MDERNPVSLIDVRNALRGNITRLRFITRFSNCPRMHDESVAEHSFYTSFFVFLIVSALRYQGMDVDLGLALGKALMHDVDECFSGDFIRMFKHHSPALKAEIDNTCKELTKNLAGELVIGAPLASQVYDYWAYAKHGTEGKVVAFADFLSVVSYVVQEIESGNHRMLQQVGELRKFWGSFLSDDYKFLRDYVDMAGDIIKDMEEERHAREVLRKLEKAKPLSEEDDLFRRAGQNGEDHTLSKSPV